MLKSGQLQQEQKQQQQQPVEPLAQAPLRRRLDAKTQQSFPWHGKYHQRLQQLERPSAPLITYSYRAAKYPHPFNPGQRVIGQDVPSEAMQQTQARMSRASSRLPDIYMPTAYRNRAIRQESVRALHDNQSDNLGRRMCDVSAFQERCLKYPMFFK
jgi:hypothetical protein